MFGKYAVACVLSASVGTAASAGGFSFDLGKYNLGDKLKNLQWDHGHDRDDCKDVDVSKKMRGGHDGLFANRGKGGKGMKGGKGWGLGDIDWGLGKGKGKGLGKGWGKGWGKDWGKGDHCKPRPKPIPSPTAALGGLGMLGLAAARRRREA